jgi:hypothetical protein
MLTTAVLSVVLPFAAPLLPPPFVPRARADTGAGAVALGALGVAATENFDTLAANGTTNSALPAGWYIFETGTGANQQYASGTGSASTGDTYSFGATAGTERALGGLRSTALVPLLGAKFTNDTGSLITSLDISYTGEQWRIGNAAAARDDRLDFQYSLNAASLTTGTWTDVNALDFTNLVKTAASVGALDGNADPNRAHVAATVSNLNIPAGASFFIRWVDLDATGSDDGLALDDFSLVPRGTAPQAAGAVIISEFRTRGPAAAATPDAFEEARDEFVEFYNATDAPLAVYTVDGSAGWALASSDGQARFCIPAGTVIPARGHFLAVNSVGYSLGNYPAGAAATANGDAVLLPGNPVPQNGYTSEIPDNAGIALFNTANPARFNAANRLDAAGSTAETNALYREGAGYPPLTSAPAADHSFHRSLCSFAGAGCTTPNVPKDTDNNAADFLYVSTDALDSGAGARLGAPGPENLSGPVQRNALLPILLLDAAAGVNSPPNRARTFGGSPASNDTHGRLLLRRRILNNTGHTVTRLRFRVIELTAEPNPPGVADLRPLAAEATTPTTAFINNDAATCQAGGFAAGTTTCTVNLVTVSPEQPPAQPSGGGLNTTLTVQLPGAGLPDGESVNVQFVFGIMDTGAFRVYVNTEVLP